MYDKSSNTEKSEANERGIAGEKDKRQIDDSNVGVLRLTK